MEYIPGVHRVTGVRGANSYLLTDDPLTLIDTGFPGNAGAILRYIEGIGRRPSDLQQILITHHHPDHAGSAAALRRATGAKICAHQAELAGQPDRLVLRGRAILRRSTPVDVALHDGQELSPGVVVIHTPGHTAGSVCYYIPQRRALFVGDLAINNITRLSRALPFSNQDSAAYERSLQRLVTLDVEVGLFGHGPPLVSGMGQALTALVQQPVAPAWLRLARGWRDLLRFALSLRGGS